MTGGSVGPARPHPVQALAPGAMPVLAVSTLAFTVCFMVWMMFAVIGIPIKQSLGLNATEFGLLTAMPVLTGSLVRVPLGIWTDRYGGRIVMAAAAGRHGAGDLADVVRDAVLALPRHRPVRRAGRRLVLGRHALRRALVPEARARAWRWASSAPAIPGAAVNKFVAPALVVAFGWTMVPQVYAAVMLGTADRVLVVQPQRSAHTSSPAR